MSKLARRESRILADSLRMPQPRTSPLVVLLRRLLLAVALLLVGTLVMYLDRDGYVDNNSPDPIGFWDALYYTSVSLSTTGYGDIAPVTPEARLVTTVVITPLRVMFLIVLVGSTLAVLTKGSRQMIRIDRWRSRIRDHTVVVGAGTKGRAAVDTLLETGLSPSDVVVVDSDAAALDVMAARGLVTVNGDATRSELLRMAGVARARSVVVATNRDDTTLLVTLTAREIGPGVRIVAAVREADNARLVRQSGASSVIVTEETAGRLLGVAVSRSAAIDYIEDLLTPAAGIALSQRELTAGEIGQSPDELPDVVLGVVRGDRLHRVGTDVAKTLEPGDELIYVRRVSADTNEGVPGTT